MYPYFELNDEERREYDHLQMIRQMNAGGYSDPWQADIYRKAHDRKYGKAADCDLCAELRSKALRPAMEDLEEAFKRPSVEPEAVSGSTAIVVLEEKSRWSPWRGERESTMSERLKAYGLL